MIKEKVMNQLTTPNFPLSEKWTARAETLGRNGERE